MLQSLLLPLFLQRVIILAPSCPAVQLLLANTGRGLHIMETIRWFWSVLSVQWHPVAAWGLAGGQAVNDLAEAFHRRRCVQLIHGRQTVDGFKGWGRHTVLYRVEAGILFHPSLHLLAPHGDYFPSGGFEGGCLALDLSSCLSNAIIHWCSLMFPVAAAVWVYSLSCVRYSLAQRLAVCWALLLAALRICRFFSLEECLYSATTARLVSITGVISVDLASNQSCIFEVFFQKIANAVRCMVSRSVPLRCDRVSGLWDAKFSLKHRRKLFHEVWLKHLANIDAGVPLFLGAIDPPWLSQSALW